MRSRWAAVLVEVVGSESGWGQWRAAPCFSGDSMRNEVLKHETYRESARRLLAAVMAHAEARMAYEAALDVLEEARNQAILNGLEGRNEQARNAALAQLCQEQEQALRSARLTYRVAEANLKAAEVVERLEREALRSLQALAAEGVEA